MRIHGNRRRSQLSLCLEAAPSFRLAEPEALSIMEHQVTTIRDRWDGLCDEARLGAAERRLLWRRQFLNDLAFEGLEDRFRPALRGLPVP